MSNTRELRGVLTSVEDKCAFASTSEGPVFIPIASARNKNETLVSLKNKFRHQDEVELTVKTQAPRNSCKLIATKMKKVKKTEEEEVIPDDEYGPLLASVTSANDSFAFAFSDEEGFGGIFLPGQAFDSAVVKNISKYLQTDDLVILTVKRQREKSGCKWQAVKVTKHLTEELPKQIEQVEPVLLSFGTVIEVTENCVCVLDENKGIYVNCSQLTYTGGLRGNNRAETLKELIKPEEKVMFKAICTDDKSYKAIEWKPIEDGVDDLEIPRKKRTADSYSQTCADDVQLLLKAILQENSSYVKKFSLLCQNIPESLLPFPYNKFSWE